MTGEKNTVEEENTNVKTNQLWSDRTDLKSNGGVFCFLHRQGEKRNQ